MSDKGYNPQAGIDKINFEVIRPLIMASSIIKKGPLLRGRLR